MIDQKKNVLLVEDDVFFRVMICRLIKQLDPEAIVEVVDTAAKAMEAIKTDQSVKRTYDLVISDLDLGSDTSGMDLWNQCLKSQPTMPFLLISGQPLEKFLKLLGDANQVPAYLPKPFRQNQCKDMILSLLRGSMEQAA